MSYHGELNHECYQNPHRSIKLKHEGQLLFRLGFSELLIFFFRLIGFERPDGIPYFSFYIGSVRLEILRVFIRIPDPLLEQTFLNLRGNIFFRKITTLLNLLVLLLDVSLERTRVLDRVTEGIFEWLGWRLICIL